MDRVPEASEDSLGEQAGREQDKQGPRLAGKELPAAHTVLGAGQADVGPGLRALGFVLRLTALRPSEPPGVDRPPRPAGVSPPALPGDSSRLLRTALQSRSPWTRAGRSPDPST